jgi:hypothetical protein
MSSIEVLSMYIPYITKFFKCYWKSECFLHLEIKLKSSESGLIFLCNTKCMFVSAHLFLVFSTQLFIGKITPVAY